MNIHIQELEKDGITIIPVLLEDMHVQSMKMNFEQRLNQIKWNDFEGYEKTELYRHMIQDVLTIDQGFIDLALHPKIKEILGSYIGDDYELVEAKGWKSLPTKRDFHGWHADAWYDQKNANHIPRELKVAIYLSDVKTGAFMYMKGTHQKFHPQGIKSSDDLGLISNSEICEVKGKTGTVFIFDTSGIHRQGTPVLEERYAVFLNYHNPSILLQDEDVEYYRYHPLLLNAAFLGNLSELDKKILGFGNKAQYIHLFKRQPRYQLYQLLNMSIFNLILRLENIIERVLNRLSQILK